MGFPTKGISIDLSRATPTPYTSEVLRSQLESIGLDCATLTHAYLGQQVDAVSAQLHNGACESFGIHSGSGATTSQEIAEWTADDAAGALAASGVTANWTPHGTALGYGQILELITFPAHFDWLYSNRASTGFVGVKDDFRKHGQYGTVAAIQTMFVSACTAASSTLVSGLNKAAMKATLTNMIAPLKDKTLKDYTAPHPLTDPWPSRNIWLVEHYVPSPNDPNTGSADGIGVTSIRYTMTVKDYRESGTDKPIVHDTKLEVKIESILYGNISQMCADFKSVVDQFGLHPSAQCPPS